METFYVLLAICVGNWPVPVNSPHKGQWHRALMFSLICARINDWVNNREADDLRCHRGHYHISVMYFLYVNLQMIKPHSKGLFCYVIVRPSILFWRHIVKSVSFDMTNTERHTYTYTLVWYMNFTIHNSSSMIMQSAKLFLLWINKKCI